jgi:hypothetical protein
VDADEVTMGNEKQRKTFLSYSRANKDFAIKLAKELKSEGFYVWLDQLDIPAGARWDREVEKALEECEIFMIILTKASINSENVLDEIGYAVDNGKRFLPVMLETCNVPLRLRRFQYVDFTTKSFDEGVESAKELLRSLVEQPTIPRVEDPMVTQDQSAQVEREAQAEADRLAKEKAEADRFAKAKADADRKAKEESDRLAAQEAETDRLWKAQKTERESKEKVMAKGNKVTKPLWIKFGIIGGTFIAIVLCGLAAMRIIPVLFVASTPTEKSTENTVATIVISTPTDTLSTNQDAVRITSISPIQGTPLKTGQVTEFEISLEYNLISADKAIIALYLEEYINDGCAVGPHQTNGGTEVEINRGKGNITARVQSTSSVTGFLSPGVNFWTNQNGIAVPPMLDEFGNFPDYCYKFSP